MSTASTTVYLYVGFDDARRKASGEWPSWRGGHLELVDWLEDRAVQLEQLYDTEFRHLELSVVFDYEVTEELGAWLYSHDAADPSEFATEARRIVAECVEQDKKRNAAWASHEL